jgi:hypothetical protein
MAVKLVVIYPRPKDVEAFETVYADILEPIYRAHPRILPSQNPDVAAWGVWATLPTQKMRFKMLCSQPRHTLTSAGVYPAHNDRH